MNIARAKKHIIHLAGTNPNHGATDAVRDARYGDHEDLAEAVETLGEAASIELYRTAAAVARAAS